MMHEARKIIISVHIPKTAGASFRAGLASVFGKRLLLDNDDRPLDGTLKARFRRARKSLAFSMRGRERFIVDYDAVHGHFIASKYSGLGEQGALCAFFRDPARRVISQAAFWRRRPDPKNAMWVEFSRQKMTAERLAGFPRQQRIYALFTGGYSLERFAFVGVTEEYETSLRLFNSMFGVDVMYHYINVDDRTDDDRTDDDRERRAVMNAQRENYLIYDQARRRFDVLCRQYLDA